MLGHRVVAACAALGVVAGAGWAQEDWIAADGDWFEASNWASGNVPTIYGAVINNGGTARIGSGEVAGLIAVGFGNPDVGYGVGDGRIVQTGGVVTLAPFSSALVIGAVGPVHGEYELVGPGKIDAPDSIVQVGREGSGRFVLSNGATARVRYLGVAPRVSMDDARTGVGELAIEGEGTRCTVLGAGSNTLVCEFGRWGTASASIRSGGVLESPGVWFASGTTEACDYEVVGEGSAVRVGRPAEFGNGVYLGHDAISSGLGLDGGLVTLTVADGGVIEPLDDGTELGFNMGGRAVLRGDGVVRAARISIYTDGHVQPGIDGLGTLTLDGLVDLTNARRQVYNGDLFPDGGFITDIVGVGEHDRVIMGGTKLGGMLRINLPDGFVPVRGDVFEVITLTDQAGLVGPDVTEMRTFDRIVSPDLGAGVVLRARYAIDKIELVAACPADINLDGVVNMDDINAFAEAFIGDHGRSETPAVDLTRDGVVNMDDIIRFVESYLGGCG